MLSEAIPGVSTFDAVPRCRILCSLLQNALLLGAFGLRSAALQAQQEPVNFDLLIFDAVPIAIQTGADEAQPALPMPQQQERQQEQQQQTVPNYQATELASLPRDNPLPVETLVRRYANPVTAARVGSDMAADDVARYEAALKQLEQKGNAYDPELTEVLMGLAASYESAGDYVSALPLYERASHITRVNQGLFSLEQVPLVERLIANQVARGDLLAADQQQEYLYYLHRRSLGDGNPALLPVMQKFAEWNVYAFRARTLSPPAMTVEEAIDNTPSSVTEPPPVEDLVSFRIQRLIMAQAIYEDIIKLLLIHYGPGDPRLPAAERALAVANYLYATQVVVSDSSLSDWQSVYYNTDLPIKMLGFSEGREALQRRVDYLEQSGTAPPAEVTKAKMELGDWLISSRKRMNAIELYDQIHAEYVASGATPAEVDALFHPALPEAIPAFVVGPYTRRSLSLPADAALQYKGHIDVEFVVGRYGQTENVRELARSADTPERVVDTLMRNIRREQYRPRFRNGEVLQEDRVQARYYYAY